MSDMEIMGGQLGLGWLRSHERMEDYGPIVRTFGVIEGKQGIVGRFTSGVVSEVERVGGGLQGSGP